MLLKLSISLLLIAAVIAFFMSAVFAAILFAVALIALVIGGWLHGAPDEKELWPEQWFNCPYCPASHNGHGVVQLHRVTKCAPMMECPDCKRARAVSKRLIQERLHQYFEGN